MSKGPLPRVLHAVSGILFLVCFLVVSTQQVAAASRASYYDFGPYYSRQQQVLGLTLSSLEQLPAPTIPQNILPPPATGIMPGNPLHGFELFVENVQLALPQDPIKREELRLQIANERLSEAKALIDQKQYDLAAETAVDYKHTMEAVTQNMEGLKKSNASGVDSLLTKVENTASAHAVVAQSFILSSPPAVISTWNTITNATENAMDHAADVAGKPAIPQDLSTSIQELKSQGILTPEQSDKMYSLNSRKDVREELDKLLASGQFPLAEIVKLDQAVLENYPTAYKETMNAFQFAELRTYQALPQPSSDIAEKLEEWNKQKSENVPPPPEIRPYLYTQRAETLAKNIDFGNFTLQQQTEVAKFYPQAIEENPTIQISPTPLPSLAPTITPSLSPTPTSPPLPTPTPPSAEPYITGQNGALPGDPTYFLKQFGEQVSLATTFDSKRRSEILMRYAEERFREANRLSKDKNKQEIYADTLKRYKDTFETVSKDIKNFKGDEEDKKDLAEELQIEAARHNVVLEKGLLPVPSVETKIFTEVIKTTENAMDRSADALNQPSLPIALVDRLQDLKAQGLIVSEEVDQLSKADSREEVREKVRKLVELGTFPSADAKKLDEAQTLVAPNDYNQLVEVRKVEELQQLRAVQAEFAQTATLRQTNATYEERLKALTNTIDPSLIKSEDLAGREELLKTYKTLAANADKRPINGGQFGQEVIPGFTPSITPSVTPSPQDAVLTTCPIGAVFKQFEGCVWESNSKKLNDYDQYRCNGSREYWSFAANKCVPSDNTPGIKEDGSPLCPIGYAWSWQTQSCQTSTGGTILPSPTPQPTPATEKESEERSKSCPQGSTYKAPNGCVWDDSGKSVSDQEQYRCGRGQYYSFEEFKCVANPKPGEPFKKDGHPTCADPNTWWSWSDGKCIIPKPVAIGTTGAETLSVPQPTFIAPDSPFYFLKRASEAVQGAVAFSDQAKQEVRLAQAKERFVEGYYFLEKKDEERFKKTLAEYTGKMQEVYNDMPKIEKLNDSAQKALGEKLADQVVEQNLLLQKATVIASSDVATPISAAVSITIQGVDRAADLKGEPPIPSDIKEKIEALPEDMIKSKDKEKLLKAENRVDARIKLGGLTSIGALSQNDTAFLDREIKEADPQEIIKLEELQRLSEIASLEEKNTEIKERVEKAEDITKKLDEFQKIFEVGKEVPADIRPYVRLTRIEEVAQTIRPDIVNLGDFGNRKDIQLAVATLKEEFKPTKEAIKKLEDFRRNNPGRPLPFELARVEALSFGLGVRDNATACFLPSPPFAPNTPCPPPGAAIPIASSYTSFSGGTGFGGFGQGGKYVVIGDAIVEADTLRVPSTDKDGKPFVYGQGPKSTSAGSCPDGYHWMYDSGGWCMSNSGNYSSTSYTSTEYTPTGPGYTPYSPYYNAPGVPPGSYGYQGPGNYSTFTNTYSPPNYYGVAPTYYTTNPPAGTVPGTGPQPTAPGQCPSGFHWMPPSYNQGGWCMADSGTYVPGGSSTPYSGSGITTSSTPPPGGYNCGSQPYDPETKRCKDGACPGGFNWDGNKCVASPYSPNLTKESCGPGYYWDGKGCIPTSTSTGGSTPWCWSAFPPPGGWSCGSGSSWDAASCSCKASSSSSSNYSPSSYQYGCSSGNYWDGSKCVAGSYEGTGWSDTAARSGSWCQPSSSGCGSNSYWDYGSCSCRASTSSSGGTTSSSGSCPAGSHWMSDSGGYCMSDSTNSGSSGSSTSGGSSSGSCPSGYHWMSDGGGWCMSDGGSSSGGTTSTSTTTTTTESTPPPSTTVSSPPPSSPPPSEPAPTSAPAPTTSP